MKYLYPLYLLVTIMAIPSIAFDFRATPRSCRCSWREEMRYWFVTRWAYIRDGGAP